MFQALIEVFGLIRRLNIERYIEHGWLIIGGFNGEDGVLASVMLIKKGEARQKV